MKIGSIFKVNRLGYRDIRKLVSQYRKKFENPLHYIANNVTISCDGYSCDGYCDFTVSNLKYLLFPKSRVTKGEFQVKTPIIYKTRVSYKKNGFNHSTETKFP